MEKDEGCRIIIGELLMREQGKKEEDGEKKTRDQEAKRKIKKEKRR